MLLLSVISASVARVWRYINSIIIIIIIIPIPMPLFPLPRHIEHHSHGIPVVPIPISTSMSTCQFGWTSILYNIFLVDSFQHTDCNWFTSTVVHVRTGQSLLTGQENSSLMNSANNKSVFCIIITISLFLYEKLNLHYIRKLQTASQRQTSTSESLLSYDKHYNDSCIVKVLNTAMSLTTA